jgi:hypothetical protein
MSVNIITDRSRTTGVQFPARAYIFVLSQPPDRLRALAASYPVGILRCFLEGEGTGVES